jgi:hypothetical protein
MLGHGGIFEIGPRPLSLLERPAAALIGPASRRIHR